jgi:(4-O-methyl)-D-glucuronate---lignin esterase
MKEITKFMRLNFSPAILFLLCASVLIDSSLVAVNATSATNAPPLRRTDAHGNPIRRAITGHISNYDESKVGHYTLPNPLVLENGRPVRNAKAWFKERRPELLKLYDDDIYGRVPTNAPKVTFKVAEMDTNALGGLAIHKLVLIRFGDETNGPVMHLNEYLPANATWPVPMLLQIVFFSNPPIPDPAVPSAHLNRRFRFPFSEAGPMTNIIERGYGYATFRYTEVQPDSRDSYQSGVIGLTLKPGQTKPAPDEWGAISAWAWGASRVLDYFETDPAVDAKRVALIGHSRLGKTVLWAGAQDPRFALIFSSCAGEMGSSLARRDYGETIDDIAVNFPWQFAGNFQKYVGHWNDLPVDAHELIALNAPHPVFITGGTGDQWSDPRGEFLAEVAAGPVYRMLGLKGLGTTNFPPVDTPLLNGDLGWNYHTGPHAITPEDWKDFLKFAGRYLKPEPVGPLIPNSAK